MKRIITGIAVAGLALIAADAPQTSPVVGILNDIHAVNDLEKTLSFYKAVFGLSGDIRPFPNPGVPLLTNAPGVSLKLAVMRLPKAEHGFELTDFTGIERVPKRAQFSDPGAASLNIYVRDVNAVYDAARKFGAEIVTLGGQPADIPFEGGTTHAVMMRDPDGYFVQAIQAAPAADAPEGNVLRVALGFTMEDAEKTLKFYRDLLGFQLAGPTPFAREWKKMVLTGVKNVKTRHLTGVIPTTKAQIEFTEFKGVPRKKFVMRVRDPGAPAMCLRVTDIEGLLKKMKAAGVPVISAKGELVQFSPTVRNIFVQDPNGLNIELYETFPAPAKQ